MPPNGVRASSWQSPGPRFRGQYKMRPNHRSWIGGFPSGPGLIASAYIHLFNQPTNWSWNYIRKMLLFAWGQAVPGLITHKHILFAWGSMQRCNWGSCITNDNWRDNCDHNNIDDINDSNTNDYNSNSNSIISTTTTVRILRILSITSLARVISKWGVGTDR